MQTRLTQLSALALGIAGVLALGSAHATGFQLRENSVKNLGRANSGTAVASDDASVVVNNPAAMVNLQKATFQADATDIDLTAHFHGGGYADAGTPLQNPLTGGDGGDPGSPKVVPAVAFVMPVADNFRLGASISAPFGLNTEYDADWVGRYNAINSDVKTVDLTLSAAWAITPQFSVGLGAIYQRSEVTLSNAIDFGSALCAGSGNPLNCLNPAFPFHPQGNDGTVVVKGDANDWGWVAGAQWRVTDSFVLGYSHHSKISHTLRGSADFTLPASVAATFGALGVTAYNDGAIYAPLTTPSIDTLSAQWNVAPAWRLYADYQRTGWHSLQQVAIFRDGGAPLGPAEAFNWKNTNYFGIGAEWDVSPAFTLRAGLAHDQTPTRDDTRDARLPDNNRQLYSIGVTWHASDAFSIDAAFQRINIKTPTVDIITSSGSSLTGDFDGHANLFGLSMQYRF
ncbi:MAG TPA: OmpP1/FadL family transporter [Xanthomonadaceae bacterium]|nr:OmpP1/FadL family transporter [Xanthomonadaceae bacterium]